MLTKLVNLCIANGVSKYDTNRELSSCTPTILGLHHLIDESINSLFATFFQRLGKIHRCSRTLTASMKTRRNDSSFSTFFNGHLSRTCAIIESNVFDRTKGERKLFFCDSSNHQINKEYP